MIYPEFPGYGDVIGVCAPSAGVGHKLDSYEASVRVLEKNGWRVHETAGVRLDDLRGGSARERADELHQLFEASDVKFVMAASGGDFLDEMLPYVNWEILKKHPKWLMGASDPTGLLYPLTTICDIATIYGSNAGSFDVLDERYAASSAADGQTAIPAASQQWDYLRRTLHIISGDIQKQRTWDRRLQKAPFLSDSAVFDEDNSCRDNTGGTYSARGRCIGGCIDVLKDLMGTPFDGTHQFLSRYKNDGIIWYFDNFALSAEVFYRTLLQMRFAGWFEEGVTKAVLIGRTAIPSSDTGMTYEEAVQLAMGDLPVIWDADVGHMIPHFTMINGAMLNLTLQEGKAELEFELV